MLTNVRKIIELSQKKLLRLQNDGIIFMTTPIFCKVTNFKAFCLNLECKDMKGKNMVEKAEYNLKDPIRGFSTDYPCL